MPWKIRLLTAEEWSAGPRKIGDAVFASWLTGERLSWLAPEYIKNHIAKRPPIVVHLPDHTEFCVDEVFFEDGKPGDHGWTVTGELPNITVSPSINIKRGWHGYITNGMISDDVEGRTFG